MTIFDAVLLGLLQALGEFLPISSSAHLVLLPYLRGMEYQGLAFDVMLHAATLLAVLLYFAKDWFTLVKDGLTRPTSPQGRTLWYLAAATVPAGVAGVKRLGGTHLSQSVSHCLLLNSVCVPAVVGGPESGKPSGAKSFL